MNDNAKAWVKALRSGEYQQGHGSLNRGGKFCCLGVACEVAIKSGLPVITSGHGDPTDACVAYDSWSGVLPPSVRDWLGLKHSEGWYSLTSANPEHLDCTLINNNDKQGYSFAQIADVIESEPVGLFA